MLSIFIYLKSRVMEQGGETERSVLGWFAHFPVACSSWDWAKQMPEDLGGWGEGTVTPSHSPMKASRKG